MGNIPQMEHMGNVTKFPWNFPWNLNFPVASQRGTCNFEAMIFSSCRNHTGQGSEPSSCGKCGSCGISWYFMGCVCSVLWDFMGFCRGLFMKVFMGFSWVFMNISWDVHGILLDHIRSHRVLWDFHRNWILVQSNKAIISSYLAGDIPWSQEQPRRSSCQRFRFLLAINWSIKYQLQIHVAFTLWKFGT